MDLQTSYYVMGIIFMSVMFVLMIALVVLVFYIKGKINDMQKNIEEKIEVVTSFGQMGGKAVEKFKEFLENKNKKN